MIKTTNEVFHFFSYLLFSLLNSGSQNQCPAPRWWVAAPGAEPCVAPLNTIGLNT